MSLDLLATAHPGHVEGEVGLDDMSYLERGGNHFAGEEKDSNEIVLNDHEQATKDSKNESYHDLENNQTENYDDFVEKTSTEEQYPDEVEDGFDMESGIAICEHAKSDNPATVKIPEVEIIFEANEVIEIGNGDGGPVASLKAGPNMQQEDAMSEIDYDHNDNDSVDLGTGDQMIEQDMAGADAEEENRSEQARNAEKSDFVEDAADSQKEASNTDPNKVAQQENSRSFDRQIQNESNDCEDENSELIEDDDFVRVPNAEVEEPDVPHEEKADNMNDQNTIVYEDLAMDPLEHDNDYQEETDHMEFTELDQSTDDFSNPPSVQVCYREASYAMFQKSHEDEPGSFFFSDLEALDFPLSQFLASLREVVDDVADDDEVLIRIDDLGLEFAETTDKKLLDQTVFRSLVDLHDRLVRADNPDSRHHSLQIFLVTRPNCRRRLETLLDGANVGEGLEAYRLSYPEYLTVDFPIKPAGSDDSLSCQDEDSNVELNHYYELEGEEFDVTDATDPENQAPDNAVVAGEGPDSRSHGNLNGQVIDEKGQPASVPSDHAQSYPPETVDTEGDNADNDATDPLYDLSEGAEEPSGNPSPSEEVQDPRAVEVDVEVEDLEVEVEEQIAHNPSDDVSAGQGSDTNASATEVNESADNIVAVNIADHPDSELAAVVLPYSEGTENDDETSSQGDGDNVDAENGDANQEEVVGLEGSTEIVEAYAEGIFASIGPESCGEPKLTYLLPKAHYDEVAHAAEVGLEGWQDQENPEDETVISVYEAGDPLTADESEQTSASGTLAGDDVAAIDTYDATALVETDGNMDNSLAQHDADEIDWEDNAEETITGGTHLSMPASSTVKRGRADEVDEAGDQHDVKRHRA